MWNSNIISPSDHEMSSIYARQYFLSTFSFIKEKELAVECRREDRSWDWAESAFIKQTSKFSASYLASSLLIVLTSYIIQVFNWFWQLLFKTSFVVFWVLRLENYEIWKEFSEPNLIITKTSLFGNCVCVSNFYGLRFLVFIGPS